MVALSHMMYLWPGQSSSLPPFIFVSMQWIVFNIRWSLRWSPLLAVLEKVNLLLEGTVCSVVNSCRKGKREKGKREKGKMEKGKERHIFYSQREIKHNSDTNGGVSFLIRLREDVSCLTGGCQSRPRCWGHACEQQHQSGPEKDWGALWVEDPAKLSQRHHLFVAFSFRYNR